MAIRNVMTCVFGALFFFLDLAGGAWAQDAACDPWDHNRNGIIEIPDMGPLFSQQLMMSECLSTNLSAAQRCEPFDADGDSIIGVRDFAGIQAMHSQFLTCFDSLVAERPDCAALDDSGDGRITNVDYMLVGRRVAQYRSCVGVDLSVLDCRSVDFDGDATVSLRDQGILYERLEAFQGCLGSRVAALDGLWISHERLMALPTQGPAWQNVLAEATSSYLEPDLSDQNDPANTRTLAKALVGVRLSRPALIDQVRRALRAVTYGRSETGARSLAVGRELVAYVLAADIIDLATRDPALDEDFRAKLAYLREVDLGGRTLVSTHEDRPNNWGTHAGATRIAIALYLGDDEDLAAAAEIHRAWLGERSTHSAFRFGDLAWQEDEARPVGINSRGAERAGIDLDGAQPEEMRRGGPLGDPPARTGYAWEALQGATVVAELLANNGYPDAWSWGDDALLRAVDYLYRLHVDHGGWWATGDDRWNVWLVNHGTGSAYPAVAGVRPGKNVGFTDWTHAD